MYEQNRSIKNSKATLCSTLNVHLEDRQFNEVIIHIGTNNILRDSSQSSIDRLLQNIKICP